MGTPKNIPIEYSTASSGSQRVRCEASKLSGAERQELAISAMAKTQPLSHLAKTHKVSRKFIYRQADKAKTALQGCFTPKAEAEDVLFYLPVTKTWLVQFVLALVLIGHCSYRGIQEILRDVFDWSMSMGHIHNITRKHLAKAKEINRNQDLSMIRVGSHDEIFQCGQPILTGVALESLYCYLLVPADHRDATTWGYHLLELAEQGLQPDYTIADAASGLRAGQLEAWGEGIPCHGDVFHIERQYTQLVNYLQRRANRATTQRQKLEQTLLKPQQRSKAKQISKSLVLAQVAETEAIQLAQDIQILGEWLQHDVLSLAGPTLATRQSLYDSPIQI
jgi:hypothetical protein